MSESRPPSPGGESPKAASDPSAEAAAPPDEGGAEVSPDQPPPSPEAPAPSPPEGTADAPEPSPEEPAPGPALEGPATPPLVDDDPPPPRPPPRGSLGLAPGEIPDGDDGTMSLVDHLTELRARIVTSLISVLVAACGCYAFSHEILALLTTAAPPQQKFVFLSPAEAFFTHLSVSFWAGLLVAAPIVIYQAWQFLRPGLTAQERTASKALFPVIALFFFAGAFFAYAVILPLGLEFLLSFAGPSLEATLSIRAYATFVLTFLLVFGAAFELPVLLFVAARVGLVSPEDLAASRPYFVVGLVTVSALLTPPDVVTQLLLAFPIWILFELTLVLLRVLP